MSFEARLSRVEELLGMMEQPGTPVDPRIAEFILSTIPGDDPPSSGYRGPSPDPAAVAYVEKVLKDLTAMSPEQLDVFFATMQSGSN